MANWKKIFEEDSIEGVEKKPTSKISESSSRKRSLFEEEDISGLYEEDEDYYEALEAELGAGDEYDLEDIDLEKPKKKSIFSSFKGKNKFEEDELEDYEDDDYYAALEEEISNSKEDEKKSIFSSFFNKKSTKEDEVEEYDYIDYDLDELEDEEDYKARKSAFSFTSLKERFVKKDKDSKEELEDFEELSYEDEEENKDEEAKPKKSPFTFSNLKEMFTEKDKSKEDVDDSEELYYEDELEDEDQVEVRPKKSTFSFAVLKERFTRHSKIKEDEEFELEEDLEKKETSKDRDDYLESFDFEEDYQDEFEDLEKEEARDSKPQFSFFNKGSKKREERSKDFFEEEEVFDEEEEYGKAREGGIFSKLAFLFQSKDKDVKTQVQEEYSEDYEEDEAEDYKTYLEKQKHERYEEGYEEDYEEDYEYEDDFEYQEDKKSSGNEFLSSVKNKLNKFTSSGLKEDEDLDDYDYDEELEYGRDKGKSNLFGKFMNKLSKSKEEQELEEEFEIEFQDESISDKLEHIEEKEISEEDEENISIQETLKSFGIEAENIRSVDVFEDRSSREERRQHPTLASVKVRRILQEKEIDSLTYDLSLSDSKDKFVDRLNRSREEKLEEDLSTGFYHSKNEEEISRLNEDFNKLDRKQNRISVSDNYLRDTGGDKIDSLMDNIRSTQEEISRDTRDYSIEIEESEGAASRRAKMRYTSLDDVLEGNEEFLETDIDRSRYSDYTDSEPHPEEVENLRKDLFKDKTSHDLISKERRSNLDDLILETNLVENSKDQESEEIEKLKENLELIRSDKEASVYEDDYEDEEISIEKVARDSEYSFENYDELKSWDSEKTRDSYSDYRLEDEEIEELKSQSSIDYRSDKTDIESLNREIKQRKVDEYRAQYWGTKSSDDNKTSNEDIVLSSTTTQSAKDKYKEDLSKKFQEEKPVGIDYQERLYTNDVDDYFVDENAPLTFGEYKTLDRGYRPVSKEQIAEKQRKLDEIFEKYSNIRIPRRNTTEYVENKFASSARVDKYKPTQVISAIHGTNIPKPTIIRESSSKATEKKNYFKEIASKEEFTWDIDLPARTPKKKKVKK